MTLGMREGGGGGGGGFNLFITSHELLIAKRIFTGPFIDFFPVFNNTLFDSSNARG